MIVKVSRKNKNTLDTKNVPIIFVPGVMGSRLMLMNGLPLWDPDTAGLMILMAALEAQRKGKLLNASETKAKVMTKGHKSMKADENARGWGGISWKYYGKALIALQACAKKFGNNSKLYGYGYDWRQSNKISGAGLQKKIDEVLTKENAKQVIIVTHSMGGLVTRWACKNGSASKVLGVIHVTQPVTGAVVLYRRFKTGTKAGIIFEDFDGKGLVDNVFAKIVGDTAENFQRISCGIKGVFELLPTNHHPKFSSEESNSSSSTPSSMQAVPSYQITPQTRTHNHWLLLDSFLEKNFDPSASSIYTLYKDEKGQVGLFNYTRNWAYYVAKFKKAAEGTTKSSILDKLADQAIKLTKDENTSITELFKRLPSGLAGMVLEDGVGDIAKFMAKEISIDKYTGENIKKNIVSAESFHKDLEVWNHPNTYVISVEAHDTDTGTLLEKSNNPFYPVKTKRLAKKGDGTVTLGSQTALKIPADRQHLFRDPSIKTHADVFDSAPVNNKVTEFVGKVMLSANNG